MNTLLAGLFSDASIDLTGYNFHLDVRLGCDRPWFGSNPLSPSIESDCLGGSMLLLAGLRRRQQG